MRFAAIPTRTKILLLIAIILIAVAVGLSFIKVNKNSSGASYIPPGGDPLAHETTVQVQVIDNGQKGYGKLTFVSAQVCDESAEAVANDPSVTSTGIGSVDGIFTCTIPQGDFTFTSFAYTSELSGVSDAGATTGLYSTNSDQPVDVPAGTNVVYQATINSDGSVILAQYVPGQGFVTLNQGGDN